MTSRMLANLNLNKRWNSTSERLNHHQSTTQLHKRAGSGSLVNLNAATKNTPTGNELRHGVRDGAYFEDDGMIKFYLRGRPIIVYAPTDVMETYSWSKMNMAPTSKLKIEWVYGYRGRDCRSNLHLLPTGEMIYFIAAVVVLFNVDEQQQRHYVGHTDDVKCLVVHPNKLLIASGQTTGHDRKEGKAHVRIWNSVSLHTLHVIGLGDFQNSISCLAFSKADGGTFLVAIDDSTHHNLSLWDWQKGEKGTKITETKCSSELVVAVEFHPMDRYSFVTCGKGHVCFWTFENGTISRKMGLLEQRDKPKYVTCLAFADNGDVLSGDSNGSISIWSRGSTSILKILRNAHQGPVFALLVLKDGRIVSGGGKDGQLILWDPSYRRTGYVAEIAEIHGNVRALSQGKGSQILVGTTRNCIVGGNFDIPFSPLVEGHTGELWAVCAHPNQNQFLSAGYDQRIQLWDSMSRSLIWSKDVAESLQSACFSPDGSLLVVGTSVGKWMAMDAQTRDVYDTHIDGHEPIQVVKMSPNGNLLAVGSRDNNIYIYQTGHVDRRPKFNRMGRCTGHSSFITHLDWAVDSIHLRSNSGDHEILFWNTEICRQVAQSSQLRDLQWSSDTCTLSFATFGIWPEGADGSDVNSCCASNSQKLIVSGDDFGRVNLFSFPACQPKSLHHSFGGHSSHVTSVCFLHDDSRVLSTGGNDSSIIQWSLQ